MKKLFLFLTISLLALAPAGAPTQQSAPVRLVGDITAVAASAHTITVHADTGESVTVTTTEQTAYTRMPAGATDLKEGERVPFAEVRVGDRLRAPGVSTAGGSATRLILMVRAAGAAGGNGQNAGRRLNGRVVPAARAQQLIVVQ